MVRLIQHDGVMPKGMSQNWRIALVCSFFGVLLVVGFTLFPLAAMLSPGSESAPFGTAIDQPVELTSPPVRTITTVEEWKSSISSGQRILFVDCDWNGDVFNYRRTFWDFAKWCRANSNCRMLSVKIDPDFQDDLTNVLQDLWARNRISSGGMKNMGGAGRVVWFENGQVVDYAWWAEVPDFAALKWRTRKVFGLPLALK
jgi:hypothetical protein